MHSWLWWSCLSSRWKGNEWQVACLLLLLLLLLNVPYYCHNTVRLGTPKYLSLIRKIPLRECFVSHRTTMLHTTHELLLLLLLLLFAGTDVSLSPRRTDCLRFSISFLSYASVRVCLQSLQKKKKKNNVCTTSSVAAFDLCRIHSKREIVRERSTIASLT